jgi:hypothetical protein
MLLESLARFLHIGYDTINVIIFCILVPALFLYMLLRIRRLKWQLKLANVSLNTKTDMCNYYEWHDEQQNREIRYLDGELEELKYKSQQQ